MLSKELLAIIVEIGLDEGLVVLGSFRDGGAGYFNHSRNLIVWGTPDDTSIALTNQLFRQGEYVIRRMEAWDRTRKQFPEKGNARITFLASDGLEM